METFKATSDVVMCTLTSAELEDVGGAWQKLFRTSLLTRVSVPGGLRLSFSPGGEQALRQLIAIERDCCPWITFVLDGPSVAWKRPVPVRVPPVPRPATAVGSGARSR